MKRSTSALVAGVVAAIVVLIAGIVYTSTRTKDYESTATLTLAPTPANPDDVPSVLEAFTRSGTALTYVQLIGSNDTLIRAGDPDVDITVRSIPDSRVLTVTATGAEGAVQPAVNAVVAAATKEEARLRDVWQLETVERATAPEASGASDAVLIVGSVVLALVAGGLVFAVFRKLLAPPSDPWSSGGTRDDVSSDVGDAPPFAPRIPTRS